MKYKIKFDFPYSATWFKGYFYDGNIKYPTWTENEYEAKLIDSMEEASAIARFYSGKYSYSIEVVKMNQ